MIGVERIVSRIEDLFAALAIAILLACTAAVCVDVLLRYAFNRPLVWVTEVTEYALVYITFLGIAWAVPRKGHVVVDVFVNPLPPRAKALAQVFNNLVALSIAVMLTVWGTLTTLDAYARGLFKPTTLAVPTWIVLAIIPVGCAVLSLRFIVECARSFSGLVRGETGAASTPDITATGLE